jgi:hypothetical protein
MVGADRPDFDAVQPILNAVGTTVVLVGPPGSGQTVKAANQLIVAGNIELVAEAIVFLRARGRYRGRRLGALRRPRRKPNPGTQGRQHACWQFRTWFSDRLAPQRHGHCHFRCPRTRRRDSARRTHRTTDGRCPGARRRRSGPFGPAAWRRTTLGAYALMSHISGVPGDGDPSPCLSNSLTLVSNLRPLREIRREMSGNRPNTPHRSEI